MNHVALFSNQNKSSKTIEDQRLKTTKSNCSFFANVYVGCQAGRHDLNKFFENENQSFPPSLSDSAGDLQQGNKADLLRYFERSHDHVLSDHKVSTVVIDGTALVHGVETWTSQNLLRIQ